MIKRTTFFKAVAATLALAFVAVLGSPLLSRAQGPFNYFWWQVTDEFGVPYTGENVMCSVYSRGNGDQKQLHLTTKLNTAVSPAVQNTGQSGNAVMPNQIYSDVNGRLHFYAATSDTVSVSCYYAGGGSAHIDKLSTTFHKLMLPRQLGGRQVSRFIYSLNTAQTNSGITIPPGGLIRDVIVQNLSVNVSTGVQEITTAATTLHLNVGFGGNHKAATMVALVNILDLTNRTNANTTGGEWLRPQFVPTTGSLPTAQYAANHRGGALSQFHAATCAGGVCGLPSVYVETPYLVHVAAGLDITYQTSGCGGSATASQQVCPHGYVYVVWDRLHAGLGRSGDAVNTAGGGSGIY